jgi:hypothetical protein
MWIVERIIVACTTLRRSSARQVLALEPSRHDHSRTYPDGACCVWSPPTRSGAWDRRTDALEQQLTREERAVQLSLAEVRSVIPASGLARPWSLRTRSMRQSLHRTKPPRRPGSRPRRAG